MTDLVCEPPDSWRQTAFLGTTHVDEMQPTKQAAQSFHHRSYNLQMMPQPVTRFSVMLSVKQSGLPQICPLSTESKSCLMPLAGT